MEFLENINEFLKLPIGIISSLGVGSALLYKAGHWFHSRVLNPIKRTVSNTDELANKLPMIEQLYKEFQPNGGASIRDQLNRIEALSKAHLRISRKAFWLADSTGNWTHVSPALAHLSSLSESELYGTGWINMIERSVREDFKEEMESAVQEGREGEVETVLKGENRVKAYILPLKSPDASILGFIGWMEKV